MKTLIRAARPDEFEAVGLLTEEGYRVDGFLEHANGSADDYAHTLRDASGRAEKAELVVAIEDESLLGTLTWCPVGSPYRELASRDDQGEFRMLAVGAAARRRGVGRTLVHWCIARAMSDDLSEIVLCSMDQMRSAHALYTSLGFVRAPELDWHPVPSVTLLGFRLSLRGATS